MKKEKLLALANNIIDYGPIIVTVLVGAYASFWAFNESVSNEQILQWILAILLLIASVQLIDRFRVLRSTDIKLDKLIAVFRGEAGAKGFLQKSLPDFRSRLASAKSISISGVSLAGTSNNMLNTIQDRMQKGTPVRILVTDPDPEKPIADVAAYRLEKHQDPEMLRRSIMHAIDNFSLMVKHDPKGELLNIRVLPYPTIFGIWLIDYGTPDAEVWVEIYLFRKTPEPAFQLLPRRDGEWYDFFVEQFEKMWSASRMWDPVNNTYVT